MPQALSGIIYALLGAGGATFIWTVVRSYLAIKNSAEMREDKAIANLEKWREESDTRADECLKQRDFWQSRAGTLEHLCRTNGIEVPPVQT